jgi:hypothetical protein
LLFDLACFLLLWLVANGFFKPFVHGWLLSLVSVSDLSLLLFGSVVRLVADSVNFLLFVAPLIVADSVWRCMVGC